MARARFQRLIPGASEAPAACSIRGWGVRVGGGGEREEEGSQRSRCWGPPSTKKREAGGLECGHVLAAEGLSCRSA